MLSMLQYCDVLDQLRMRACAAHCNFMLSRPILRTLDTIVHHRVDVYFHCYLGLYSCTDERLVRVNI